MGKKENNYYSPSKYQIYRNASKVMNSSNSVGKEYSIHDDEYFYRQIQAENNRHKERQTNKPEKPKPPVNINKPEPENKHYSVYDEIAARRKKQKENSEQTDTKVFKKEPDAKDTKLYNIATERKFKNQIPLTEKETEDFIYGVTKSAESPRTDKSEYMDSDIEEICEYYRRKYSRKMWITLICSLSFFCLIFAGMYLYLNGFF